MKSAFPLLLVLGSLLASCTSRPEPGAETATPPITVPPATVVPETVAAPVLSAVELARQDSAHLLTVVVQTRFPQLQVIDFKAGDLNADGRRDVIVVAGQPCNSPQTLPRTVLLLLNAGSGRLRIAAVNQQGLVMAGACMGVWPSSFRFVGRRFEFSFFEGSCQRTSYYAVFRYEPARRDWFLHQRRRIDRDCRNGEIEEMTQTRRTFGRVRFADYTGGEF